MLCNDTGGVALILLKLHLLSQTLACLRAQTPLSFRHTPADASWRYKESAYKLSTILT